MVHNRTKDKREGVLIADNYTGQKFTIIPSCVSLATGLRENERVYAGQVVQTASGYQLHTQTGIYDFPADATPVMIMPFWECN